MMGQHMGGDARVFLVLPDLVLVLAIPLPKGRQVSPAPAALQIIAGGSVPVIPLIKFIRAKLQAQSQGIMGVITVETEPGLWGIAGGADSAVYVGNPRCRIHTSQCMRTCGEHRYRIPTQ
ncbi:MAG: hypothetical protein WB763_00800 [Terriglobia bacterium]|jgi:hypothetical protein